MARRTSPVVGLAFLAIVVATAMGVHAEGFNKLNESNLTSNQTDVMQSFTGNFVELLPFLVLVLAGVFVVRAALDWTKFG